MYFCKNCDSILDISKKIDNPYLKEYKDVANYLDDIDNNDTAGILKFNFKLDDILSNNEFKKKDKKNQEIILKQYKEKSNKLNVSYFVCKNCNFHDVLHSECVIFKSNLNEDIKEDLFLQNDRYLDNTIYVQINHVILIKNQMNLQKKQFFTDQYKINTIYHTNV